MERASGEARRLVRHGKNSILGNPDWSPDGRRIVFSSNWRIGHQIYLLDAEGTEEARLSPILGGGCEPRFSPDGRKVVYVSRGHHGDKSRLVEHDIASGKETRARGLARAELRARSTRRTARSWPSPRTSRAST